MATQSETAQSGFVCSGAAITAERVSRRFGKVVALNRSEPFSRPGHRFRARWDPTDRARPPSCAS